MVGDLIRDDIIGYKISLTTGWKNSIKTLGVRKLIERRNGEKKRTNGGGRCMRVEDGRRMNCSMIWSV